MISGSAAAAIKNALPAFGGKSGRPVRAVTACRLCTAARRIPRPVPVHLPAHHQICLTHGTWLSGPGTHRSSASGAAPASWPPSARHAGSSGAAPSSG